jgi:hypothetical protein
MYVVPKSKKSLKQNKFEFELAGQQFTLPRVKFLSPSEGLALEKSGAAGVRDLFEKYAPGAFELFEDGEQFEALTEAWQEDSKDTAGGVSLGESQASLAS